MKQEEISPNIYGIETEYSCTASLPGNIVNEMVGSCHSMDVELGLYEEPTRNSTDSIDEKTLNQAFRSLGMYRSQFGGMLSNGGRYYFDPSGPEYDTPECTTAEEAVHRSFDGDRICLSIFDYLQNNKSIRGYQVNRRIIDHNRTSRGIHLNTTTSLEPSEEIFDDYEIRNRIACLNVVKGAIFGSGGLLLNESGQTEFHHSPRLSLTNNLSAEYSMYKKRPLVRVPFKEEGDMYRVETVTSDALNFAWPLRASLVSTNALIHLLEMGYVDSLPSLGSRDAVRSAVVVGQFGNEKEIKVKTNTYDNYKKRKPLDILRDICEIAFEVDHKQGFLDDESDQVLGEIIEVADKMSLDEDSVVDQVESIARKNYFEKKFEQRNTDINSELACRIDYAWDWLGGGGVAEGLRQKKNRGWHGFSKGYSEKDTSKRMTTPPTDTRAFLRANDIVEAEGVGSFNWSTILLDDEKDSRHYIHPLDTKKPSTALEPYSGLWLP